MNQYNTSITIGIPTYNRAKHLESLLLQFEALGTQIDVTKYNVEILISNNASSDKTQYVINGFRDRLEKIGYKFRCFEQEHNLGMDGNFRFLYENCKSSYLWYFSDDDILIPENTEELFDDLNRFMPDVCLSNFIQSPYTENNTIFLSGLSKRYELITDLKISVNNIIKYTKLTNYIIKKIQVDDFDVLIDDCAGDYYLFIVYSLLAFSHSRTLLVRNASIAMARPDYLSIEYSPRAFVGLHRSVNKVLKYFGSNEYMALLVNEHKSDEMNASLTFLIMHYRGKLNLSPKILAEEHSYIDSNFMSAVTRPKVVLKYVMYVISILYSKLLIVFGFREKI